MEDDASIAEAVIKAQKKMPSVRHVDSAFPADERSIALLRGEGSGASGGDQIDW